jgi:hypothetical protein
MDALGISKLTAKKYNTGQIAIDQTLIKETEVNKIKKIKQNYSSTG